MAIFTGSLLLDMIGFIVTTLAGIYVVIQWNYRYWKRKNVPYFEPTLPHGNMQPFYKPQAMHDCIFGIAKKAQQEGMYKKFNLLSNI